MVMLSATIDAPEKFAYWCETCKPSDKKVYLSTTHHRVVPLTHYGYLTTNEGVYKKIKDKATDYKNSIMLKLKPFEGIENMNDSKWIRVMSLCATNLWGPTLECMMHGLKT